MAVSATAAIVRAQTAPIVQPGAPGQESRIITAGAASDLSKVQFTDADVRFMQGMIGHHAQALEMTALRAARSEADDINGLVVAEGARLGIPTPANAAIVDLKLPREQIGGFLATAEAALTRPVFLALFGPFPDVNAENQAEVEKLRAFTAFVQATLRSLVTAMQQLGAKFKQDDPKSVADALTLVCESRRDGFVAEIKKLTPAPITPG